MLPIYPYPMGSWGQLLDIHYRNQRIFQCNDMSVMFQNSQKALVVLDYVSQYICISKAKVKYIYSDVWNTDHWLSGWPGIESLSHRKTTSSNSAIKYTIIHIFMWHLMHSHAIRYNIGKRWYVGTCHISLTMHVWVWSRNRLNINLLTFLKIYICILWFGQWWHMKVDVHVFGVSWWSCYFIAVISVFLLL